MLNKQQLTQIQHDILNLLNTEGIMQRKLICDKLNRAWTTVFDHLEILETNNLVCRFSINEGKVGRPRTIWISLEEGVIS